MTLQAIIFVILIGGIIALAIAAWLSMRQSYQRNAEWKREPTMQERQAELHRKMRRETGHVDTMIMRIPPKDDDTDEKMP